MEKLRARAESLGKGLIKFGVVLPLSGPLAEQGNALLAGMRYAVQAHNAGLEPKVELVVRDSEGNMIRAIQAAQSFCRDMDVAAIVGDLESHVTEAAAAVAQENGVPLIAPTAMEDGISGIGPFVFQLNGTLGDRARSLADYTVKGLGLSRFALFYPADGYGKVMRKAFTDAVTSLGGEILAEKWYSEGTEDFNPAMAALREAGIKRMLLDSLAAAGGAVTDLSGQWVDQKAASLADQRELPVTSIDAFLVLPSRSNIESIVSQVHYHNLETQLLGGASWDDPVFLNRHADVLDGLVFYSDYYVDPYNPNVLRFREGFRKMTGKNPDRFETIGYDAVSVLLDALGNRSVSREELRDRLAAVSGFIGVRGRIAFDNERVNAAFRLLQFKENRLVVVR
jgi:ABC-type branched-subunit amino acid transport system substrate-binding protein